MQGPIKIKHTLEETIKEADFQPLSVLFVFMLKKALNQVQTQINSNIDYICDSIKNSE